MRNDDNSDIKDDIRVIRADVSEIKVDTARNASSLEEHMRRTIALENELAQHKLVDDAMHGEFKEFINKIHGSTRTLAIIIGAPAIIYYILSMIDGFKHLLLK